VSSAAPHPWRDVGLQGERTTLAWRRTAAAIVGNAILILRSGLMSGRHTVTTLAILLMIASGALFAFGAWRGRHLIRAHGEVAPPTLAPFLTAALTLAACATGAWSIFD
jgi:uncharacterized membrane protein YidH (DUF202 family)